jgi:Ca2+-binding EF-hand superfamily protein
MRGAENEEIVLTKAFKHFDFNNSGAIDIKEF